MNSDIYIKKEALPKMDKCMHMSICSGLNLVRRLVQFAICILWLLWLLIMTGCTQEPLAPETTLIPIQAKIVWMTGDSIVNPVAVDYIRLTIKSDCDGKSYVKTFPYALNVGSAASVKTGCSFNLKCEGLTSSGQVLYVGEENGLSAEGAVMDVRITASGCTPVPPDSLTALRAGRRIALSWIDCSNNESGFIIKRALGKGTNYLVLDTVTTTSYLDTFDISRVNPYYYQVYSYNTVGVSIIPGTLDSLYLVKIHGPISSQISQIWTRLLRSITFTVIPYDILTLMLEIVWY